MRFVTGLAAMLALAATVRADETVTQLVANPDRQYQTIAGFGVNFNGSYFRESQKPMIDMLIDDLGATLFRFDPYGLTNWETRNDNDDPRVMDQAYFADRFSNPYWEASWAAARYLNSRAIRPILDFSGTAPDWMLTDRVQGSAKHDRLRPDMYEEYAETLVAAALYARAKAHVNYEYFGPLNETDCPPIEGPGVNPEEMPTLLRAIAGRLRREGLGDLKLVAVDQCSMRADYFSAILADPELMKQVGVFSLHTYGKESLAPQVARIKASKYPSTPIWLTEYGDLNDRDFSADNEWSKFCVEATRRAVRALLEGASAALFWDAYDNFHEHDQRMTFYGLVRNNDHLYTPKKRYYAAKQLYRYVKPGAVRIELTGMPESMTAAAFRNPDGEVVVVGVKQGGANQVHIEAPGAREWEVVQTTRDLNCTQTPRSARDGSAHLADESVFTLIGR